MLAAFSRRFAVVLLAALITCALVAAVALAGPLGSPPPAPPAGAASTVLTLTGPSRAVPYGAKTTFSGRLTSAGKSLAGKTVTLYRGSDAAGWSAVADDKTDGKGKLSFKLKPTATATYAVAFKPDGTADAGKLAASESPALTVTVRADLSLTVDNTLRDRNGRLLVLPGRKIKLHGSLQPGSDGETVSVRITREGKVALEQEVPLHSHRYSIGFDPARKAKYHIEVSALGSTGVYPVSIERSLTVKLPKTHPGGRGPSVRLLQRSLRSLGYVTPINGHYGHSTARAVLTFKKVNHMRRNGFANKAVWKKLAKGRGGFKLRYPKAGRHVEFDWSRQVLVLANHGRAERIYHASSGKPSTPTVFGTFRFYSRQAGFNSHGMYFSTYFIRGYAVHGYASVPKFPASHGCIRVPIPQAVSIYKWINLGMRISVYR